MRKTHVAVANHLVCSEAHLDPLDRTVVVRLPLQASNHVTVKALYHRFNQVNVILGQVHETERTMHATCQIAVVLLDFQFAEVQDRHSHKLLFTGPAAQCPSCNSHHCWTRKETLQLARVSAAIYADFFEQYESCYCCLSCYQNVM